MCMPGPVRNYRKGEWTAAAADFDRAAELIQKSRTSNISAAMRTAPVGDFEKAREILERFRRHSSRSLLTRSPASAMWQSSRAGSMKPRRTETCAGAVARRDTGALRLRAARAQAPRLSRSHSAAGKGNCQKLPTLTQAHYQLFLAYSRLKQTDKAQTELAEFKAPWALEKQVEKERIVDEKLRTQQMLGQAP